MSEFDPTGKNAHELGSKMDGGKPRLDLMMTDFSDALVAVAGVSGHGAAKYTEHGWLTVPDGRKRYMAALYRHVLKHSAGEINDPDSKLTHLAHAAWNALAVLQLHLNATGAKDENQLEIDFNKIRGTTEQSSTGAATGRVYPGTNIARPIQVEETAHLHEHERKREQCITCGGIGHCRCLDFTGCGYCGEKGHIEEECEQNPRTAAV